MTDASMFTVTETTSCIRQGKLSPVELIDSVLRRIDLLEPTIKAWVTLDRQGAVATAHRYSKEAERGIFRGPLHGIPVGIKDIFYTAKLKTTAGSRICQGFLPTFDATAITHLKKAGAIILGKTTTTEFAMSDPAETKNPWNLKHTPGGSSSGSAAAVSSGMCPVALGSQTGGSTLRPASFCGIVGLKPTHGRVSMHGVIPVSWSLDHVGILTRTVEDAALLLGVLAGYDPHDWFSSRHPVHSYQKSLKELDHPSIGVLHEFFSDRAEEDVRTNMEATIRKLSLAGAKVEEIHLPKSFKAVHEAQETIMRVEVAAFHKEMYQTQSMNYRPKSRDFISTGLVIPGTAYVEAHCIKKRFRRDMESIVRRVDAILTPTAPTPAPEGLESIGDSSFNVPWSFCGFPAISIPSGLSTERLPLGIQLVGGPFAEKRLLQVAFWCEKVIGFDHTPHEPIKS